MPRMNETWNWNIPAHFPIYFSDIKVFPNISNFLFVGDVLQPEV